MRRRDILEPALVALLLAAIVAYGVALRLDDPLSTRALAAEDPYTHVVLIEEWTSAGAFGDSVHLATAMYPPGMHAFVGAFVPFTGIELHAFARLAPPFLAALGILGTFALGERLGGRVAGLAAAFVTATLPEHIFRSELFFPTAFDLALLPAWILAFHMALRDHPRAGAVLFVGTSVPLALMHPWVVPLFAAPLALFAAIGAWRSLTPARGIARAGALLAGPVAFAMAFRWDTSDTGFADFAAHVPGLAWLAATPIPAPVVFLGVALVLAALIALAAGVIHLARRVPRPPGARWLPIAVGAALLVAIPFLARDPPQDVSYNDMLGGLAILLALAGFALAFARPTPLGELGACLGVVLYPLTTLDLFDSPYWPQRTVAYLAVGVALLAANALAHAAHGAAWLLSRAPRTRAVAGPASMAALALVLVGTSVAVPADTYAWYRMYDEDDFEAFEEIAAQLANDPASKVYVYTWQPALLVKALAGPEHVWYSPGFFNDGATRERQLDDAHGAVYVLVDKHTTRADEAGKIDLAFLGADRYHIVAGTPDMAVRLYEVER